MDEKILLKVALICSLVGVFIILFLSENLEPSFSDIGDISDFSVDAPVRIKGSVASVKKFPSTYLLNIKDSTGAVTVVVFDESLAVSENSMVEISGVVKSYKGKLEVEAKEVKVVG